MKTDQKNQVLETMMALIREHQADLMSINQQDVNDYKGQDTAMQERLVLNQKVVDGMIKSLEVVRENDDPVGIDRYQFLHSQGMKVVNRTAPFGTVLIIYESRPDVTIEAAAIAFKAGNKILLKGGKESKRSNLKLVELWHSALNSHGLESEWIQYLDLSRPETQQFLKNPDCKLDLIVPRGGRTLIQFVKQHSNVPVLVSGRGNNFIYVHSDADWEKVTAIVLNAKTHKISACNALDKILFHQQTPNLEERLNELVKRLQDCAVEVWCDQRALEMLSSSDCRSVTNEDIWYEEFLELKIVIGVIESLPNAIAFINEYSGGHSNGIVTENADDAQHFMDSIDSGAVYHNASTRFTDGGQFGLGAELAISTDKLHHRGPLGLPHLVTNKWYVYGDGQTRD